jgi:hypothetical protein
MVAPLFSAPGMQENRRRRLESLLTVGGGFFRTQRINDSSTQRLLCAG